MSKSVHVEFGGVVVIEKRVQLSTSQMRELIKMVVSGSGEWDDSEVIHDRWSVLYNAYDMMYDADIRMEHKIANMGLRPKMSRLAWAEANGLIKRLLYIASKLYPAKFEEYVEEVL